MLEKLGLAFESWVRRHMPDPFVLVLLLSGLTFALAYAIHPTAAQLEILQRQLPQFAAAKIFFPKRRFCRFSIRQTPPISKYLL